MAAKFTAPSSRWASRLGHTRMALRHLRMVKDESEEEGEDRGLSVAGACNAAIAEANVILARVEQADEKERES